MKIQAIALSLLMFLTLGCFGAESYPPEGWTTDLLGAIRESEETGKDVLMNFTGSDWCVWCHRLRDEVFQTRAFKEYAEENLILVFLDFPNGIEQSEETVKQNQVMASLFGVRGFPTIWLMDSDQVPLLQAGYMQGGGEAFVKALQENRIELDDAKREEFQDILRRGIRDNIGSW